MQFVDKVKVSLKAGKGGDGAVSAVAAPIPTPI